MEKLIPYISFKDIKNQLSKGKLKEMLKDDRPKHKKSPYSDYMRKFYSDKL